MQTKDYREAYDNLPETAKSAMLALSVLTERIASLPKSDRDDLFELFRGMGATDDPEELACIRRAMEEILAQAPVRSGGMPFPEAPPTSRKLKAWTEHIGRKIKELRKAAGLSQVELAEMSGLPQSHISRLENAEHSATNLTLEKIATALGISVGEIDPCLD